MGSAPSTPNQEHNENPWWSIERQYLDLNPNSTMSTNETTRSSDDTNEAVAVSECQVETSTSDVNNEKIVSEKCEVQATDVDENVMQNTVRQMQPNVNQSLEEFKEELRLKREQRQSAIGDLRNEITSLRSQLAEQKAMNRKLMADRNDELDGDSDTDVVVVDRAEKTKLAKVELALQQANSEILSLSEELLATQRQVRALKDAVVVSKEMVSIRENQLTQLKSRLVQIESSLADREAQLMSENLRHEYDRQLTNIRNLRTLYDERARINAAERENLNRQLETSRAELEAEVEKNKNLEEHIASLDADLKSTSTDLFAAREQIDHYKAENRDLHGEMAVINQLFSQLLSGFNGCNTIDIDKLTHMLEENRELLNEMTNGEGGREEAAQLPKLLFDLVTEVDKNDESGIDSQAATEDESTGNKSKVTSAQEIMNNLPKVWKVLMELLNHQQLMAPIEAKESNCEADCYNSVQTPTGPQLVPSVSKTYIKLKDLILEKKFLQKETKKLKNLNQHLGTRLEHQERRLGTVSVELNKTWNLVGRMQRQRRQLHTQGQVLRYHLQQKRRMMSELKDELEYCRRKWDLAKEKNKESQSQWDALRLEFSKRKEQDSNNSAESGYSDGPVSEEDEDADEESVAETNDTKRRGNKEKFLLKVEKTPRKNLRIHSVSPIRTAKMLHAIQRRNSESHVAQFATEVYQAMPIEVAPIELVTAKSEIHVCVAKVSDCLCGKISVEVPSTSAAKPTTGNVCGARKIAEAKSGLKTNFELRKTANKQMSAATSKKKNKSNESLEAMFLRLSGQMPEEEIQSENEVEQMPEESQEVEETPIESSVQEIDEEEEQPREVRIQQLQDGCGDLLSQVTNASIRVDELNRQADGIHQRHSQRTQSTTSTLPDPLPSTSTKTDEECLTQAERDYTTRRSERLTRLEAESREFLERMNRRANRAMNIDNRLEYLHGQYGDESTTETDVTEVNNTASGQQTPDESNTNEGDADQSQ